MSSSVTDPGLVMKTLRIMSAKVEELQQEALQNRQAASYREILIERRFKEQDKQITALKRKRCDSCSTPSSANSSSTAKQPRKSSTVSQKKLPPSSEKPATPAVNILTAAAVSEAVKEVLDLEADNSMEGVFQATLPARGWEAKDIPSEYLDTCYFYNFKKSGGLKPLARAKVAEARDPDDHPE